MAIPGDDAAAVPTHQHSPKAEPGTPDLTESETVTDGGATDDEFEYANLFQANMQLLHAKGEITTLKKQVNEYKDRVIKAEERAQNLESASDSFDSNEVEELRLRLMQVEKERDSAMTLRGRAEHEVKAAREEARGLATELDKAETTNQALANRLQAAEMSAARVDPEAVQRLHATITTRDNNIDKLHLEIDKLKAEHRAAVSETTARDHNASETIRAQLEVQKAKVDELKDRLSYAESERTRYREERDNLSHTQTSQANNQLVSVRQVSNFNSENNKLRADIVHLNAKIRSLHWSIGMCIADLDIVNADYRVFTCTHARLNGIPDGYNSTREKPVWLVAEEVFNSNSNDANFMVEYNNARAFVLDHHRAHERVNQGRGEFASTLKNEFLNVDDKRGVHATYR